MRDKLFRRISIALVIIFLWPQIGLTQPGSLRQMAAQERGTLGQSQEHSLIEEVRNAIVKNSPRDQKSPIAQTIAEKLTLEDTQAIVGLFKSGVSGSQRQKEILRIVSKYSIGRSQVQTIINITESVLARNKPVSIPAVTKNNKPTILFIMLNSHKTSDWDPGRHLTAGALISPLLDKNFLVRYFQQLGKDEFINKSGEYPSFNVNVVSLGPEYATPQEKAEALKRYMENMPNKPDIVSMSLYSEMRPECREVAQALEQGAPGAIRIIGGAHASIDANDALRQTGFHIAVLGEGVETFCELLVKIARTNGKIDLSDVNGIAYWDQGGNIKLNNPRKYLFGLDDYPQGTRHLDLFWPNMGQQAKKGEIAVLAGIGCNFDCAYCGNRAVRLGVGARLRSPKSLVEEIKDLYKKGFYHFALLSDNFCQSKENVLEFTRLVREEKRKGNLGDDFVYTIGARADDIDKELLDEMHDTGLIWVEIGVETADPKVLGHARKRQQLDHLKEITQYANNKLGIGVHWYIMVGLPNQGWQSILKTALYMDEVKPIPWGRPSSVRQRATNCAHTVLVTTPYPGTRVAQERKVRMVNIPKDAPEGWVPDRQPEVDVVDGKFVGVNYTETDAMLAEEIFEAQILLRDFYHLYLHSLPHNLPQHPPIDSFRCAENRVYSRQVMYAIFRRAIRDLIVNAQKDLTYESRKRAFYEVLKIDGETEVKLPEYTKTWKRDEIDILYECAANVTFTNGFNIMKHFSVDNRIKWMKLMAYFWKHFGKRFDHIRFDTEDEQLGIRINKFLDTFGHKELNAFLAAVNERTENILVDFKHLRERKVGVLERAMLTFESSFGKRELIVRISDFRRTVELTGGRPTNIPGIVVCEIEEDDRRAEIEKLVEIDLALSSI